MHRNDQCDLWMDNRIPIKAKTRNMEERTQTTRGEDNGRRKHEIRPRKIMQEIIAIIL